MKQIPFSLMLTITALFLAGCKEEPPPPPAPKPKAEPTPEDIAKEIRTKTDFLKTWLAGTPPPDPKQAAAEVAGVVSKHRATDNGKTAISQVAREVEEVIRQGEEQKRWGIVSTGIDVYNTLVPSSTKYSRLKEKAQLELNKPVVKLNGFFVDQAANNQEYVFIEVFDPPTGETTKLQVREGEEFNNLRLLKIIGRQKGIQLEYLPTGDTFDVMK